MKVRPSISRQGEKRSVGVLPPVDFDVLRRGLEDCYSVCLPSVSNEVSSSKEFCTGLLADQRSHPWYRSTRCLPMRDRLSISGSLFLWRKVLPSKAPSVSSYMEKMATPAPDPPPGFIRFVTSSVKSMFPRGWDRGWESKVHSATITTSSCLEASRKDGGARALLTWVSRSFVDRSEFCANLLSKFDTGLRPSVSFARIALAPCAGKTRIVSINSVEASYLLPYHRLVYDRLCKEDWCLRGEATASCFSDFVQKDGEVFVSGDYESATDNLNQDVARSILETIGMSCTRVPLFVREASLRTLGGFLTDGVSGVVQERGQLMGNPMSFPLLCLQNYLAFRFLVKRDVPVRINGDDIVFRARPEEFDVWKQGVTACGLTLSAGKTAVSNHWFSLNSSFFTAGRKRVRLCPVVRSTAIFRALEGPSALRGKFETFRGFGPGRRLVWEKILLNRFSSDIWFSQLSLRRGLGIRLSRRSIIESGLRERECFYESLPLSQDQIQGSVVRDYVPCAIPRGWYRVRVPRKEDMPRELVDAIIDEAWYPTVGSAPEGSVCKGAVRYVRPLSPKILRLARGVLRSMCLRRKPVLTRVSSLGFLAWRKERVGDLSQHCQLFTRAGFA